MLSSRVPIRSSFETNEDKDPELSGSARPKRSPTIMERDRRSNLIGGSAILIIMTLILIIVFLLFGYNVQASNCINQTTQIKSSEVKPVLYPSKRCTRVSIGGNPNDKNYGAWPICDSIISTEYEPIIYSFGIGGDISFDIQMIKTYNAKVYGFDPTIGPENVQRMLLNHSAEIRNKFIFKEIGMGARDAVIGFYHKLSGTGSLVSKKGLPGYKDTPSLKVSVFTIPTIMRILQHSWVDIVKIDIEGAEFDVFLDAEMDIAKLPTSQILIEQHGRLYGKNETDAKSLVSSLIERFEQSGFSLITRPGEWEMCFLRTSL